jgi:hypothetical protein
MIGEKKTVYHSTLVKHGPTQITIKSDVRNNKFNKYGSIEIEHEGQQQWISPENQAVADALRGLQGQTVNVTASGSKGDAKLEVTHTDGSSVAPMKTTPRQQLSRADGWRQLQNGMFSAWKKGYQVKTELEAFAKNHGIEITMTPEQLTAVASQLFRAAQDRGIIDQIPVKANE